MVCRKLIEHHDKEIIKKIKAENIFNSDYTKNKSALEEIFSEPLGYEAYANRTKLKYEKTKTPFSDGEERLLEDVYVCNILSSRLSATKNRHSRTQERTILNANLDSISEYSNRVILVANGGMGKSMMLQHL